METSRAEDFQKLLSELATVLPNINVSYWLLQSLAMIVTCVLVKGLKVTGIFGALLTVLGLSLVNATIWDTALFFELPNSFSMHAVTLILANGIIFWILVKLLPGIEIKGVLPAIYAPIIFSVISMLIAKYEDQIPWAKIFSFVVEETKTVKDGLMHDREKHQ